MLFSVIMPVYNAEKWLPSSIESVKKQTYPDWELIVVDDGSQDQSGSICDSYAKGDKKIHVIHQKNQGVSAARNTGVDHSHGEYLVFLDADDTLERNFLEKAADKAAVRPDAMLVNVKQIRNHHKISDFGWSVSSNQSDDWLRLFLLAGFAREVFRKICKREIWQDLKFPIGFSRGEDLYMEPDLVKQIHHFSVVEGSYYYYNKMPHGSATENGKLKGFVFDFLAWKHGLDSLDTQHLEEKESQKLKKLYEASCTQYALSYLHDCAAEQADATKDLMESWIRKIGGGIDSKAQMNLRKVEAEVAFYSAAISLLGPLSPIWSERAVKSVIRLYAMMKAYPESCEQIKSLLETIERWKQTELTISTSLKWKLYLAERGLLPGLQAKGKKLLRK